MRYVQLNEFGGPEQMSIAEAEGPSVGPGELLIAVAAAGVNRPDIIQRQGFYPAPKGHSPVLGLEVAGRVAALGEGVSGFSVGQPVCALTNGGGYASEVAVPAGQCLPVPEGLSLIEAAALPETFFTVWENVVRRGKLAAGEHFLVHGGSSGIGTTAIQLANALGARVYTTAGSEEKCRACEALGAELAINYREQDFVSALQAQVPFGMDLILDMVGGGYVARNMALAAMEGRIVNIAFLQGAEVSLNLLPVMLKRLTLTGSTLRAQSNEAKAVIANELQAQVWPWLVTGKIKPVIHASLPLAQVAEAHRMMESGQHIGKIVLTLE